MDESDFVVARSQEGFYIRVAAAEIPEKGKGAGCIKFMSIADTDNIEEVAVGSIKDSITVGEKEVAFTRIKPVRRGGKGTKLRL